MRADADEEDGFDWEAAVAAMENISLLANKQKHEDTGSVLENHTNRNGQQTKQGAPREASQPTTKMCQKTLLSFVQRYSKQPGSSRAKFEHVDGGSRISEADAPCSIDPVSAKTWIYPVNVPMRDYQFSIAQTALFSNTLVSLPTGLGKTLIAAVVMYNYFRWFPRGKIVFTAPSRPLVLQQIEACHDSVGIPQEWTIDMTGQMSPVQRLAYWKEKKVFFVTPQVLEKDIHSGSCPINDLVCLVVDEAHRATGNYSYCVVLRKLMEASIKLRILALTATPGSKQATIQAVVDNLHISCLEYRSENDDDVRQYVHTRKIELLQVAMDVECLTIKDVFLEVSQPLVNRLCGFGVFYSRDAARLAPYEFLTARDKFRQAPPLGLDQRQYAEVEACFGSVITLYHIFKLLFSHGVRPAHEMLSQKLQSGPFARLMGRNEKLLQAKLLMQKHIGNGASSPKLRKMEELIIDHFKMNNPANTRVIVFTNFRESVKEILETLKKLGNDVRAMEFIGQSSGKFSKGQSQKVQQSVLQKFRAGGFNTIVATSIAEEGLDIMEVDLVICFDANISPLRMIQRMGRTGRKRDGRVIVLASEGAEIQGYLKKQAKSKALGKHMHNNGVNSFNFHSSPRMVPHLFKPEVELIELSIAKFVPRGKNKQKAAEVLDPGTSDLTVEELLVLRRYIEPSQPATWKPSLIAFPHCQLFSTCVHKIRHSVKTISMLIDTLQSLHDLRVKGKNDSQVSTYEGDVVEGPERIQEQVTLEVETGSKHALQTSASDLANPPSTFPTERPVLVKESCKPSDHSDSPLLYDELLESSIAVHYVSPVEEVDDCHTPPQCVSEKLDACPISVHFEVNRCMLSEGIVSVDTAGYVQIASPPLLPPKSPLHCWHNGSGHRCFDNDKNAKVLHKSDFTTVSPFSPRVAKQGYEVEDDLLPLVEVTENTTLAPSNTPGHRLGYFVASTPEERILQETSKHNKLLNVGVNPIYDSPRLTSLAEQGVVPLSPGLNSSSIPKWKDLVQPVRLFHEVPCNAETKDSFGTEHKELQSYGVKSVSDAVLSPSRFPANIFEEISNTGNCRTAIGVHDKTIRPTDISTSSKLPGNGQSTTLVPNSEQNTTPFSAGLGTSLLLQSSKNNSGSWKLSMEAACSVHKPRKFKRLRRVQDLQKETLKFCSSQRPVQKNMAKKSRSVKQKRRLAAVMLIEEEAEVSSDETVSADEDESEDDERLLQDFIDDGVEPTAVTGEDVNEPIDMMAIYRKSLLTQSPLDGDLIPWMRFLRPNTTSVSENLGSSGSESRLSASLLSHEKVDPGSGEKSAGTASILSSTPLLKNSSACIVSSDSNVRQYEENCNSSKDCYLVEHPNSTQAAFKIHDRKRRLSFQQQTSSIAMEVPNVPGNFDDDVFTGVDLDALEVEAVQKSRSHLQMHTSQQGVGKAVLNLQAGSQVDDKCRAHDEDFECFPTFDLGFEC